MLTHARVQATTAFPFHLIGSPVLLKSVCAPTELRSALLLTRALFEGVRLCTIREEEERIGRFAGVEGSRERNRCGSRVRMSGPAVFRMFLLRQNSCSLPKTPLCQTPFGIHLLLCPAQPFPLPLGPPFDLANHALPSQSNYIYSSRPYSR